MATDPAGGATVHETSTSAGSEKYGPYTSIFPFYGDIYERFWRDEYHFTLFPLYGRTVKKGTTSTNWLYPFFNTVSGENESGFQFWPLYGQASKDRGLRQTLRPLAVLHQRAPRPGHGQPHQKPIPAAVVRIIGIAATQRNLRPLALLRRGAGRQRDRHRAGLYLAFLDDGQWQGLLHRTLPPLLCRVTGKGQQQPLGNVADLPPANHRLRPNSARKRPICSTSCSAGRTNPGPRPARTGASSTFWPLYAWKRDEDGMRTLSMPALVEPVIWNDGVERNWAPLWRIFIAKWDDKGNGATSILWNLYWQEKRGSESAWELSPLVSYRSTSAGTDFRLLKGLFGYRRKRTGQRCGFYGYRSGFR